MTSFIDLSKKGSCSPKRRGIYEGELVMKKIMYKDFSLYGTRNNNNRNYATIESREIISSIQNNSIVYLDLGDFFHYDL